MTTEQKNQKIQALIKELGLKNCSKYAPEPNQGDRYPILNEKYPDTLWITIQKEKYLVVIRGNKEIGISKIIHEFIGKDYDHNDGQNDIWHFDSFNDIEKIIYAYAGVKKENMEQEFREWLEGQRTRDNNNQYDVNALVRDLKTTIPNWSQINYDNIFKIINVSIIAEIYERCSKRGDLNPESMKVSNGRPMLALNKYKEFLQSLDEKSQPNIWKISHGDNDTANFRDTWWENNQISLHKNTVSLGQNKETQADWFRNDIKVGDIVILSYSNNIKKLVTVASDVINPDDDWIRRKYTPLKTLSGNNPYKGIKKWWTPNSNSTCVKVSEKDYCYFENLILKPFFDKKLKDIGIDLICKEGQEKLMNEKLDETIKLLKSKNQIILQGSPGTGKTRFAKQIAEKIIGCISPEKLILQELNNIKGSPLEFDVDYQGAKHSLTVVDIIDNVLTVKGSGETEYTVDIQTVQELINREDINIDIYSPSKLFFAKGIAQYLSPVLDKELIEVLENFGQYKLIQFHPAYSYEDFVRGIVASSNKGSISYETKNKVLAEMAENATKDPDSDFVLVIDEINRANLSAVLGELIYALEYRGQPVESMYAIGDSRDREIILPKNLYIIGTMNTADRSVGHIDYAIRRRFAFVDVKTDESVIPEAAKILFAEIKQLFDEKLSEEFDKDDVMIGHSYFLGDDLAQALEYEIKPILCEYVKDGVLTCTKDTIYALNVN